MPKITAANILGKPKHVPEYVEPAEFVLEETSPFKKYVKRVEAVIRAADKKGGTNYRGMTQSEINRRLGEYNVDLTDASVRSLLLFHSGGPLTRYTFIDRRCRSLPRNEWPKNAKPAPYRDIDYKTYPTAGWDKSL